MSTKLEIGYICVTLAYAAILDLGKVSVARFFVQQDPRISNPYEPSSVSTLCLGVLAVLLPACLICIMRSYGQLGSTPQEPLLIAFGLVHSTQWAVVGTFKGLVGRLRPNFFALCNYCGYRDALKSGKFTDYMACAPAGLPGDFEKCRDTMKSGRLSFPSGHSSTAFAGLGFLGFMLAAAARRAGCPPLVQVLCTLPPLFAASWVAATRVQESWHFESDIFAGSTIGFSIMAFVFHTRVWPLMFADDETNRDLSPDVVESQLAVPDES